MSKTKIQTISTLNHYEITKGNRTIIVITEPDGRITAIPATAVKNPFAKDCFMFKHSDPEVVHDIGTLLLEAAKLGKQRMPAKKENKILKKTRKTDK